jgi:hypothetical protein
MVAEFRGPPPHDLGLAEIATARCVSENIEMTLHVVDDWHHPTPPNRPSADHILGSTLALGPTHRRRRSRRGGGARIVPVASSPCSQVEPV